MTTQSKQKVAKSRFDGGGSWKPWLPATKSVEQVIVVRRALKAEAERQQQRATTADPIQSQRPRPGADLRSPTSHAALRSRQSPQLGYGPAAFASPPYGIGNSSAPYDIELPIYSEGPYIPRGRGPAAAPVHTPAQVRAYAERLALAACEL